MNRTSYILAALMVPAALAGCGEVAVEGCALDADCDQGFACELQSCVAICETGANCLAGEVCRVGDDTTQTVCRPDEDATNDSTDDGDETVAAWELALLQDSSTGDVACGVGDPGSDLFFVALENREGTVLGWGRLVTEDIVTQDNAYTNDAVLSGEEPGYDTETCPEFSEDRVYSLGCTGWVVVEFLDESGERLTIEPGQQLRVAEFGAQCPSGSSADRYGVFVCTDAEAVRNDANVSSCTIDLGAGTGETTVSVAE